MPTTPLLNALQNLPESPGVYQFFNAQNRLLYVGKAKSLRHRVRSYFTFTPTLAANPKNSTRIQLMIMETTRLEFITTHSEADALILENSFIKQLRPKYNILLRDDKTYPYLYVDLNEHFPRFELTRKILKKPKVRYFGPFFRGARELMDALYLNFRLRQKRSCAKACIFHQIKRCDAPCESKISAFDYAKIVQSAVNALLNPHLLLKNLEEKMRLYAAGENYEEAAQIRDKIAVIRDLEVKIHIDIAKLEDFNVFAHASNAEFTALVRFVIQEGKIISAKQKIFPINADEIDINAFYKQVMLENFTASEPLNSAKAYVAVDFEDRGLVEQILSARFGKKFKIIVAKIGEKRHICELAQKNAEQTLKNKAFETKFTLLNELKSYFELENLPQNIEIFDNSHLQGSANVGAMVVWRNAAFDKGSYRRYHLGHANEFEQMKELLTRRIKDFDKLAAPDLWVIDGGEVLLNLAQKLIAKSGANVDIIAISKEKIDAKSHRAKGKARDIVHFMRFDGGLGELGGGLVKSFVGAEFGGENSVNFKKILGGVEFENDAENFGGKKSENSVNFSQNSQKNSRKRHGAKGALKAFSVNLSVEDKKLLFLQALRDEAHRFAIAFHRQSKRKSDLQSSKLRALGVSEGMIKKLLSHFGSFEAIYNADFTTLKGLTNTKTATAIERTKK